jgi:hypothetical protein
MTRKLKKLGWWSAVLALALSTALLPIRATAQDEGQQDDPPTRVARLGYMEGSVSFQPAGENDWVQAVPNRPMTTGDKLWADKGSRAELQLGSAVIRLSENTGFSFLNLDDHTVQIQLSSGTINLRVRRLDQGDDFEVDTPDLAFTVSQPGSYRLDASEDGTYTVVSLRDGGGQATGNGQTYTLHARQRVTFSGGTDSLNADVEDIGGPDQFDNWADGRDHRYDNSRSAQYLSRDVVGYEDLDDNGNWRDDRNYGHVWYPNNVAPGWAPYREGHWDWIPPWGYTWVDDSPWGYAPFHYGRWVVVGGRWGWVAGPVNVQPVYAPALVVFIGGGGMAFGGDVGWFPLGPREVYVPPYQVSRGYMNQVNVSNTMVNTTTITNVYNTTIINKSTNITNVTYANRNVPGAVTVVPQRAFASAQPIARAAVAVNPQQIAQAPVSSRVAVAPTQQSVLGAKASTANHVTAPPAAVMNRQVIAKRTPPPPPVPFAKQQQALAVHPGQPLAQHEIQSLRPAGAAAARPMVKQAPPGKPATPTTGHPGNPPNAGRPGQPATPPANQPANRPPNQQAPQQRPATPAEQNRPPAAQPPNRPETQPSQPPARPQTPPPAAATPTPPAESNRPPAAQPNRPAPPPEPNRPPVAQPPVRPETKPNQPPPSAERQPQRTPPPAAVKPTPPAEPNRPPAAQPPNRPPAAQPPNRPETKPSQPPARLQTPPPPERQPQRTPPPAPARPSPPPPAAAKPSPPPPHQQPNLTPEQKKQEEERKKQEKPPGA